MIDWPLLTSNLRRQYGSLEKAARVIGMNAETLRKLNRGEVREPRFTHGMMLLDAHLDVCPERHRKLLLQAREAKESRCS